MSVDTYLKGKNISSYKRVVKDDVTVLLAPMILKQANVVELVAKKKIVGQKVVALIYHDAPDSCRI